MRGAHAHQIVHEHGRGPRTLTGGDDELLRARGGGIPSGIQARDARAAGPVHEKVPVGIAVEHQARDEVQSLRCTQKVRGIGAPRRACCLRIAPCRRFAPSRPL